VIVTTTPREVPPDVIAVALATGVWACFAPAHDLDAIRVKVQKIARRRGIRVRCHAEGGRVFAVPVIGGSCGGSRRGTTRREADDLAIVAELISVVRAQARELATEMGMGS
jgi:hypothetical protein